MSQPSMVLSPYHEEEEEEQGVGGMEKGEAVHHAGPPVCVDPKDAMELGEVVYRLVEFAHELPKLSAEGQLVGRWEGGRG